MILWMDGCDQYTANADLTHNYANLSGNVATFSASGGNYLNKGYIQVLIGSAGGATTSALKKTFATAGSNPGGVGYHALFAFKIVQFPNGSIDIFRPGTNIQSSNGANPASLRLNIDGSLSVTEHGSNATVLATSPTGLLTTNTWYFVEYAANFNAVGGGQAGGGGYIKVWIGGNLIINFTGATNTGTVPTTYPDFAFGLMNLTNANSTLRFDDVMPWDESGTDFALTQVSTSYLPVMETLLGTTNDSVQWTPLASTNVSQINNAGFEDGDATYNSSNVVGQQDSFNCASMNATPAYVFAIGVDIELKVDIPGVVNLRDLLISGATQVNSADRLCTTSYARFQSAYGKDPNTSAVWGTTQPNSVKPGYNYHS